MLGSPNAPAANARNAAWRKTAVLGSSGGTAKARLNGREFCWRIVDRISGHSPLPLRSPQAVEECDEPRSAESARHPRNTRRNTTSRGESVAVRSLAPESACNCSVQWSSSSSSAADGATVVVAGAVVTSEVEETLGSEASGRRRNLGGRCGIGGRTGSARRQHDSCDTDCIGGRRRTQPGRIQWASVKVVSSTCTSPRFNSQISFHRYGSPRCRSARSHKVSWR